MLDLTKIDFKKMGFRAGIEVHHQINTKRKLFCHCKPVLSHGEPDYRFERYFRPVLGEMGDFDEGMLIEYEKGYRVIYHAYEDSVCVYEQDEQPPFWPDNEAIYLGFELAHWLNFSALVDEVVVSRKQYLDGSITTGFQRTMIVARDGWVPIRGKKLRISNLTVEEDSARKIKTENFGRTVYYNLDRLGMPLVEVITDHNDCDNPQDLQRAAEYIGLTLRLSGIGKRGLGVVRQDVNISIRGGHRVELKGVQDLSTFVDLAAREVARQDMLIKIAAMLKERIFKKKELEHTYIDLTDKFAEKNIPKNSVIMGIRLPKFGNLLGLEIQPSKDFGQDIIEKAELISGIPRSNLFHSDEIYKKAFRKLREKTLRKRKEQFQENIFFPLVTDKLDKDIRKTLKLKKEDGYFLALGPQTWVVHAMKKIIERAKMALDGVPLETRRFLPDNNSEFLRVIHGQDRLYPDTDTPPIDMDIQKIEELKKKVQKRPWEWETEFKEKYDLDYLKVKAMIRHETITTVQDLIEKFKLNPKKCYCFIEEILLALRREGFDTSKLTIERTAEIIKGAEDGVYDFNQVSNIAKTIINDPQKSLKQALSDLKIRKISDTELQKLFAEALSQLTKFKDEKIAAKDGSINNRIADKITGTIMRRTNGSISGKTVYDFVLEKLEGKISS